MSVRIGDRATFRGQRVVIMEKAPFLGQRRWKVLRLRVSSRVPGPIGWYQAIAPESSLSQIEPPSFEEGDRVRIGTHPRAHWGTITELLGGGVRPRFRVRVPERVRTSKNGVKWIRTPFTMTLGGESLRGLSE